MSVRALLLLLLVFVMAEASPAEAQRLFNETFENGLDESWGGHPGKGDIRLTDYAGNHSLRLTRNAWAARVVMLPEALASVRVSVAFAASGLERDDACLLETSPDGKVWSEQGGIGDGQDDALTLHPVSASVPVEGHGWLALRVRVDGNASNDTCWADEIVVEVDPGPQNLPTGYDLSAVFAMPEGALPPPVPFEFRLRMDSDYVADTFRLLKDDRDYGDLPDLFTLPAFEIGLVSDGIDLIPEVRGAIQGAHPRWEWLFEPGNIWLTEEGGLHASLPVALREVNANCLHTGHLDFALSAEGQVSDARVQLAGETCAYLQFDMRAMDLPLRADLTGLDNADVIRAAWRDELAARLPVRPIGEVGEDFPGVSPDAFGSPDEVDPFFMTVYGVQIGDTLYRSECNTRAGPDPFCDVLPLPSYSLAKSIVAGIALMRLEQLYPGAKEARIADYVPECTRDRWGDVTFSDALDMATGLYASDKFEADEDADTFWDFMRPTTHAGRIGEACTMYPKRASPGELWVYHTSDTYVLGTALQAFWREKSGRMEADFYDDLLVPLWRRLGLSPLLDTTGRSYDAEHQPQTGWGLVLHFDDIIRIAHFLQDGARLDGQPYLDPAMLAQALQRDPADRGLVAGDPSTRYKNGFWAWNAGPALGCRDAAWIPVMSGFGGITIALIPNGQVYAYFSDGYQFAWQRAAQGSNTISPICEDIE